MEADLTARAYGVSIEIEGRASAIPLLSTRVAGHEALVVEAVRELHAFEISPPPFVDGPTTITA